MSKPALNLKDISTILLAPDSSPEQVLEALDHFVRICVEAGGIRPDPGFDAWAGDSFLANGVAIAPQAAAHCVHDYRRTLVFIRGIHTAVEQAKLRFPGETLHILYAGCGPYATLLLPLLTQYSPDEIDVCLLDIHQPSLDSVVRLLNHFELEDYAVKTAQGDACTYIHPQPLHLVISETMQKSLEQEPQFAVTAQLAPQLCDGGIFIPQKIQVRLCLALPNRDREQAPDIETSFPVTPARAADHHQLGNILTLTPDNAEDLLQSALFHQERSTWELPPVAVKLPALDKLRSFEAALFTRIQVYGQYWLEDYDAEITLPQRLADMSPLHAGERWEISYQLGGYPRFEVRPLSGSQADQGWRD